MRRRNESALSIKWHEKDGQRVLFVRQSLESVFPSALCRGVFAVERDLDRDLPLLAVVHERLKVVVHVAPLEDGSSTTRIARGDSNVRRNVRGP